MKAKIIIAGTLSIFIALQTSHLAAMSNWWEANVACYFAQGGERLSIPERKAALYSAVFGYRYQEQQTPQTSGDDGRYDVIFFSEEALETQNPRIYSFANRIRGLVLIN